MRKLLIVLLLASFTTSIYADEYLVVRIAADVSAADYPTVSRCNGAIAQWASQYNPLTIDTRLTGPVTSEADGSKTAQLAVKIEYGRQGGVEPRAATINCIVKADGSVEVAPA
jgi:hypothetical protein